MSNESVIWDSLRSWCNNQNAVAGIMANIQAESAYRANNLQNSYNSKLGYTDDQYTQAIDNGEYTEDQFMNDRAGYGLCQWTFWSRKKAMYRFLRDRGFSIGSLEGQLAFLEYELKNSYPTVLKAVIAAKTPEEAATIILKQYEKPADQSPAACERRGKMAREIFEKYNTTEKPGSDTIKEHILQIESHLQAIKDLL